MLNGFTFCNASTVLFVLPRVTKALQPSHSGPCAYFPYCGNTLNFSTSLHSSSLIISILGFKLFDCVEVHSEFGAIEVTRNTILTDKLSLHFFELPKLQGVSSIDSNNEKDLRLALFNAETEEELEKLSQSGGAVMSEAIQAYHSVTATDEFKNLEWMRRKTAHDEAQALHNARLEEREKWQGIAAERDVALAEVEKLRAMLAKYQSEDS